MTVVAKVLTWERVLGYEDEWCIVELVLVRELGLVRALRVVDGMVSLGWLDAYGGGGNADIVTEWESNDRKVLL